MYNLLIKKDLLFGIGELFTRFVKKTIRLIISYLVIKQKLSMVRRRKLLESLMQPWDMKKLSLFEYERFKALYPDWYRLFFAGYRHTEAASIMRVLIAIKRKLTIIKRRSVSVSQEPVSQEVEPRDEWLFNEILDACESAMRAFEKGDLRMVELEYEYAHERFRELTPSERERFKALYPDCYKFLFGHGG